MTGSVFSTVILMIYFCAMAHEIQYRPSGTVFSSSLPDIPVRVDGDFVDVRLSHPLDGVLLQERLYPFNGSVTLYDLRSLIEEAMRGRRVCVSSYLLEVSSGDESSKYDSVAIRVLYCDKVIASGDLYGFTEENFLTTLDVRRVAPGASFPVTMFCRAGTVPDVRIKARYRVAGEDSIRDCSFPFRSGQQISEDSYISFEVGVDSVKSSTVEMTGYVDIELRGFTVSCGQRFLHVYADESLSRGRAFIFRNCFNVPELFQMRTVTVGKTEVSRSTATLTSKSRFYDQTVSKTYESDTDSLTFDEAEWIDQFLCSRDVSVIEPGRPGAARVMRPVLITSFTCGISDGDESLNSVKFSWRYDDDRPAVALRVSPGIFTSPYNPVFS